MSFATIANIVTTILCLAVIVQSVRMMRSLRELRGGAVTDVVKTLDHSAAQARKILSDLIEVLGECQDAARMTAEGKAIADELTVMVGIANASADRMAEAANDARRQQAEARAGGWA